LLFRYAYVFMVYALIVSLLWIIGIESIYAHVTPFYALLDPVFSAALAWSSLRWHLLSVAVFVLALCALALVLRRTHGFKDGFGKRGVAWMLVGLIAFGFAFSGAVAMIRGGPPAISAAYERHDKEYIDDIGRGLTIHGLFRDYVKMHPFLSMHAKVHPPGPIVLLWLISYPIGSREPLPLSVATMFIGALAVIPLYLWVRDMTDRRVALIACVLYTLVPSITLFTATSADILFTPITLTALLCFWRAIERGSVVYALAGGVCYAVMSLTSFSLIGIGAFFGFVGLWRLTQKAYRFKVIKTAVLMGAAFLAVHVAVRLWTGFDVIECFRVCKEQFDLDQVNLDEASPRFPAWSWRFLNPACWFYFLGIPVSLLFLWRLRRPEPGSKALFVTFALTLLVLDLLYLARGEGERSALYIVPFVAIPAAHLLSEIMEKTRSRGPLLATAGFLAFQIWLTETCLNTFW